MGDQEKKIRLQYKDSEKSKIVKRRLCKNGGTLLSVKFNKILVFPGGGNFEMKVNNNKDPFAALKNFKH